MPCPQCHSSSNHKDGFAAGKQRYRYKACDCRFTQSRKRGYGFEKKLEALRLYKEGCGFRRIGRLIGVSNVTALNWIRVFGQEAKAHILSRPLDLEDRDLAVLAELPRKTLPAIARAVGGQEQALHHFLSNSPWQAQALREQRLGLLRQALGGRAFVLCLDETGDRKKGKSTDYVARQYIGNLGKVDNERAGVGQRLWYTR